MGCEKMISKFDNTLSKILESIMVITLLITIVMTFLQVIFRYVLQWSVPWSQEFLMIFFVYSMFAGAAYLVSTGEHLVVDLFEKLPKKVDKAFSILECIVAISVLVILSYYGLELVLLNFEIEHTLGLLPLQRAYLYMAVPIFSLVMIYFYVRRLYKLCFG